MENKLFKNLSLGVLFMFGTAAIQAANPGIEDGKETSSSSVLLLHKTDDRCSSEVSIHYTAENVTTIDGNLTNLFTGVPYYIINREHGYRMDSFNDEDHCARLCSEELDPANEHYSNQVWILKLTQGGYKLFNVGTKTYLDTWGQTERARLARHDNQPGEGAYWRQVWLLTQEEAGYKISNQDSEGSKRCFLDTWGGSDRTENPHPDDRGIIHLHGHENQRDRDKHYLRQIFMFEPVDERARNTDPSRSVAIQRRHGASMAELMSEEIEIEYRLGGSTYQIADGLPINSTKIMSTSVLQPNKAKQTSTKPQPQPLTDRAFLQALQELGKNPPLLNTIRSIEVTRVQS